MQTANKLQSTDWMDAFSQIDMICCKTVEINVNNYKPTTQYPMNKYTHKTKWKRTGIKSDCFSTLGNDVN